MRSCGFGGNCGKRSTITLRGGGGMTLPGMTMFLGPIGAGGFGGLSRTITGAGVSGAGGFCVTWSGGAGGS